MTDPAPTPERSFPPPPEGSFPVIDFIAPMPLNLYAALNSAIGKTCERQGFEAFFREADGLGRVWVRRKAT